MTSNLSSPTDTEPKATVALSVSGMTCGNCARHVREALQGVPGVAKVEVSLENSRAEVRCDFSVIPGLLDAVRSAGFKANVIQADPKTPAPAKKRNLFNSWGANVGFGLACTLPLLVGEWVLGLTMHPWFQWTSFVLALPVQIFCGARFYKGAWNQIKVGSSSMDTLVALGSTTAFAYSLWALFSGLGGHVYFMEAAAIITLISLGHWMESRMSRRAESSLRALLNLAPQMARRKNVDGTETKVSVAQLRVGETITLSPGDHVPTDGEATEGQSSVDESMLTGESIPVEKAVGAKLYAGTNNLNGHLLMRVTATGEGTALARIIAAVQRAQNSRADIQRLADRVSSVFVPIVVFVAVAVALWWGLAPEQARRVHDFLGHYFWHAPMPDSTLACAIMSAAAVLIVACPCAMGLATPIAIMAGTNAAARRGILIRDGVALERAGLITSVVFDKTGTLTQGRPAVVSSKVFSTTLVPSSELKLAAALARRSQHPLSLAIAKTFPDDFVFQNWQEVRGSGVQAEYAGVGSTVRTLRLGSLQWLKSCGVNVELEAQFKGQSGTLLALAVDHQLSVLFTLQDTLKPGSAEVVKELTRQGLEVFIITGDNERTAKVIAVQVGISSQNVFANVQPEQKAMLVKELQDKGNKVAFVGDGINDAPALEQADLGIAVCQASDVASKASDLVLLRPDIQAIPEAISLARCTLRTIKQNLFWAFFYNSAAIPLAALGLLSPILCAAAMGVSDLMLVGNSLRLKVAAGGGKPLPPPES